MDRGARQVTLHSVAKIQTWLSDWVHTHICTHIWCIYTCMPIYICMHTYWQLFCLLQEIHVFSLRDCEAESTNPFRGGWAFSSFPPAAGHHHGSVTPLVEQPDSISWVRWPSRHHKGEKGDCLSSYPQTLHPRSAAYARPQGYCWPTQVTDSQWQESKGRGLEPPEAWTSDSQTVTSALVHLSEQELRPARTQGCKEPGSSYGWKSSSAAYKDILSWDAPWKWVVATTQGGQEEGDEATGSSWKHSYVTMPRI